MKYLFSVFLLLSILFSFGQADTTIHYDSQKEFNKAKPPRGYEVLVKHSEHWAVTYTPKATGQAKKDTTLKVIPTKVVLITYKEDCQETIFNYLKGFDATIVDYLDGVIICNVPKKYPIGKFIVDAKRVPCVIDAEQDIIREEKHEAIDPRYVEQWALNNSTDKDIDAPEAWAKCIGKPMVETTIAIFDGAGFDLNHVDMGNVPYRLYAYDNTTNVAPKGPYDKHATPCLSQPLGMSDNGIGIKGIGNNRLTGCAVQMGHNSQSTGTFYTSYTEKARSWSYTLTIPSCRVVSCSFGSTAYSSTEQTLINNFVKNAGGGKGGLVFASSGNSGLSTWKNYPASYANVIAVGASTSNDTRASFSNYSTGLDIAAPGQSILSLDNSGTSGYTTGDYTSFSGTSAASPVAASVGAMIFSYKPDLTNKQAYELLIKGCEKTGGYSYADLSSDSTSGTWSKELGYGRVNLYNSLTLSDGVTPIPTPTPDPVPVPTPTPIPTPIPTPGITDMSIEFLPTINYFTDSTGYVKFKYTNKGTAAIQYVTVSVGFPGSQQVRNEIRTIAPGATITVTSQKFTIPKGGARYSLTILKVNGSPDSNSSNNFDDIYINRR